MKGIKGKFLKKLKSVKPTAYYLKQDRYIQVNASDHHDNTVPSVRNQTPILCKESEPDKSNVEIIDVTELMKDIEDEDSYSEDNKENAGPLLKKLSSETEHDSRERTIKEASRLPESAANKTRQIPLSEIDISSFRRPVLNSATLFDPNLLAAFEKAVKDHMRLEEAGRKARTEKISLVKDEEPPSKARRIEEEEKENDKDIMVNPLLTFQEKCPPGGNDCVVLYTTTLRGIRKTFEECNSVRFLLESFRVVFYERDVSMHREYKEQLWKTFDGKVMPPRLFIRGRYIGGAEEVLQLHEQGKFRPLLEGISIHRSYVPCEGCGGVRFVLCSMCDGSQKVIAENGQSKQCPNCNENGLVICPRCCS